MYCMKLLYYVHQSSVETGSEDSWFIFHMGLTSMTISVMKAKSAQSFLNDDSTADAINMYLKWSTCDWFLGLWGFRNGLKMGWTPDCPAELLLVSWQLCVSLTGLWSWSLLNSELYRKLEGLCWPTGGTWIVHSHMDYCFIESPLMGYRQLAQLVKIDMTRMYFNSTFYYFVHF